VATPSPAAVSLATLLAEEVREVESFVELLRQEQALLVSASNADHLMQLVERKSDYAARLKTLSDKREELLAADGYESGRSGMEAWLANTPGSIRSLWQKLMALAAEARALNETNGKLIRIHWQHNQAALATLMSAADRAMTYGPDGQQKGGGGGRILGSA